MSSEEITILNTIISKLSDIEKILETLQNSFLWVIGICSAIFICYLMYRCVMNFISF